MNTKSALSVTAKHALKPQELYAARAIAGRKRCDVKPDERRVLANILDPIERTAASRCRSKSIIVGIRTSIIDGLNRYESRPEGWSVRHWQEFSDHSRSTKFVSSLLLIATDLYQLPAAALSEGLNYQEKICFSRNVLGKRTIDEQMQIAEDTLRAMGYTLRGRHHSIRACISNILLHSEKSKLKEISEAEFERFRASIGQARHHKALTTLSAVLHRFGNLEKRHHAARKDVNRGPQRVAPNVDPEWISWCDRWKFVSVLSDTTKTHVYSDAMTAGRWLKRYHPDVKAPAQWTFDLATEFVKFVDNMKVGELLEHPRANINMGEPLKPRSKISILRATRTVFRELVETEIVTFSFNIERALATPRQVMRSCGYSPKPIDEGMWLKLRTAAITLDQDDLPRVGISCYQYPLELIKALALTWTFSGCRSNEIRRLSTGCVRLEKVAPTFDRQTGKEVAGFSQYMLRVPVGKTRKEFEKPIEEPMALAILEWEGKRPIQPRSIDLITRQPVNYLFSVRGIQISPTFLNKGLIKMLLRKAGLPKQDSKGTITSHRARATMATRLYNSASGLSPVELMNWMGHSSFGSTQHYLELTPLKLMRSFQASTKLSENLRYVSVLVDRSPVKGEPAFLYDLGHGWCSNEAFSSCKHRLACARCDFYLPDKEFKQRTEQQRERYVEMLQKLDLTECETKAIEGDIDAAEALLRKLSDSQVPKNGRMIAKNALDSDDIVT